MKIKLRNIDIAQMSEFDARQFKYMRSFLGQKEIEPLGLTTTQIQPLSYLVSEDRFGTGLGYLNTNIFEITSHEVNPNWTFHYYTKDLWGVRLLGPRFFWGLKGLEDEVFVERFLNRDSKEVVENFMTILSRANF